MAVCTGLSCCRDYTEEENLRFADMAKGSTKDSTNNLYAPYQKLYNVSNHRTFEHMPSQQGSWQ